MDFCVREEECLQDPAREPLAIRAGEIHAWLVSVRRRADRFHELFRILSREERERALRFRFERDRNDFVAAHAALRSLLAEYTGQEPHRLELRRDANGKPMLAGRSDETALRFSMSHSEGLALCGVALDTDIGVDIERINPGSVDDDTLSGILSPSERAALDALPPAFRADALFRFWTLKEAYLKARGDGLAILPSDIDIPAARSRRTLTLTGGAKAERGAPWTLSAIPAPPGYSAAVACRGGEFRITCRFFDGGVAGPVEMTRSA